MPNFSRGDFVPIMRPSTVSYSFPTDPYLATADSDVDASHTTDRESRPSTGGHIVMVFAAAVLWLVNSCNFIYGRIGIYASSFSIKGNKMDPSYHE